MGERRKFDKAFMEQVVLQILSGETTISKMAEELNLHYSTDRDWGRYYKKDGSAFTGSSNLKPEDDEIRNLRRELADLKEENEIFKKAATYFAKNQE